MKLALLSAAFAGLAAGQDCSALENRTNLRTLHAGFIADDLHVPWCMHLDSSHNATRDRVAPLTCTDFYVAGGPDADPREVKYCYLDDMNRCRKTASILCDNLPPYPAPPPASPPPSIPMSQCAVLTSRVDIDTVGGTGAAEGAVRCYHLETDLTVRNLQDGSTHTGCENYYQIGEGGEDRQALNMVAACYNDTSTGRCQRAEWATCTMPSPPSSPAVADIGLATLGLAAPTAQALTNADGSANSGAIGGVVGGVVGGLLLVLLLMVLHKHGKLCPAKGRVSLVSKHGPASGGPPVVADVAPSSVAAAV